MKSIIIIFSAIFLTNNSFAQNIYYNIPIQHDTAIQWAAESNKVINLSPKIREFSLKKWYLEKLRSSSVTAYLSVSGSSAVASYRLSLPALKKQEWLQGLDITPSHMKHPQEWYVLDNTKAGYESYIYRGAVLKFDADSCCGCDDADAFRAKQVLSYKNGKFSIYNVFISPLCARSTSAPAFEWYPLCNVAFNDNSERKFPGMSKDVVLLNTNELDYVFDTKTTSSFDSVLTVYRTDIGSLIYQDILKGKLKAIDVETNKPIPGKKFLTSGMPADTIAVFDIDDASKITGYKVMQAERSSRDFNRLRIKQDFYFDFRNERLYSVVKSVTLMEVIYGYEGTVRGVASFCRLE